MRYDRRYPHPVELVFEAVSTAEHLDVWMLPISRVERQVGGRCSFTWGQMDEGSEDVGMITEFDPLGASHTGSRQMRAYMRFDLEPDGDGTLLHFTLYWPMAPGQTAEPDPYPGGDLPTAHDTNWRPGAIGGFHEFLDDLAPYLDERFTAADRAAQLADVESDRHVHLTDVYRGARPRSRCHPPQSPAQREGGVWWGCQRSHDRKSGSASATGAKSTSRPSIS